LLGLFIYLEDGSDIFLQSVVSSKEVHGVASQKTEVFDLYVVQEANYNFVPVRKLDQVS
jgi:hypothetical protein